LLGAPSDGPNGRSQLISQRRGRFLLLHHIHILLTSTGVLFDVHFRRAGPIQDHWFAVSILVFNNDSLLLHNMRDDWCRAADSSTWVEILSLIMGIEPPQADKIVYWTKLGEASGACIWLVG